MGLKDLLSRQQNPESMIHKELDAKTIKPGNKLKLIGSYIIVGDIPDNVKITLDGNLAVQQNSKDDLLANIGNNFILKCTGSLHAGHIGDSADIRADRVSADSVGTHSRVKTKNGGDIYIPHVGSGSSIRTSRTFGGQPKVLLKEKPEIFAKIEENVRVKCHKKSSHYIKTTGHERWAARILSDAKRALLEKDNIGCGITYDHMNERYEIPQHLIESKDHLDFILVMRDLEKAGAIIEPGFKQSGNDDEAVWHISDAGKPELGKMIDRRLRSYTANFKETALG